MTEGTRADLLAFKPKLNIVSLNGKNFYIRDNTVADVNFITFEGRKFAEKLAKQQGIELNDDEEHNARQLAKVSDQYVYARAIAGKLCDKDGHLLYDVTNEDDLKEINSLDSGLLDALTKVAEKKSQDSQSEESSK